MVALHDQLRISSHSNLAHRSGERILSCEGRFQAQRTGNECDPLMAQGGKVLYRLTNSVQVIDSNIADARARRANVYEYQRHVAKSKVVEERFLHAERHNRYAFDPVLEHAPYRGLHALGIVNRRSHQDFVIVLESSLLENMDDFREEWVCNLRNNQTKNTAAPGNQRARLSVRKIPKLFDNSPHALGQLWLHAGMTVNGTRHRGRRNSCAFSYF